MSKKFENIVVAGATSLIAQETARELASRHGSHFLLVGRNEKKLLSLAEDLRTRGAASATVKTGDLTDEKLHDALLAEGWSAEKKMDLVLMAWGILGNPKKTSVDVEAAQQILNVNFNSYVSFLTKLTPFFEKQKSGTIAVITSVAGDRGRKANYLYGAAKGGLSLYLGGLRGRLLSSGVKVLTIKPGFVSTPMTAHVPQGPLFAEADVVGRTICRTIEKGTDVSYVPWFWRWIMLVIRSIPEVIFKRMSI